MACLGVWRRLRTSFGLRRTAVFPQPAWLVGLCVPGLGARRAGEGRTGSVRSGSVIRGQGWLVCFCKSFAEVEFT